MKDKPLTNFTKELLAFVNSHEVDKFIFDIRDNGGGDSKFIEPLIEGLSKSKINRRGKLFCLIGRKTFSSAILNAAKIKRDTQAIFVGEPTSGKPCHYGQVESMKLPYSKMRVQYSTKYCGHGDMDSATLIPDIVIQLSSEDFFAGKDPVLETVLAYQEGSKRIIQASK
jgi:C-terminal processing protease CtpA/Prc